MSFRDKLESKIAGAVQNFVSPPEFTLPDILFDRLLSTENAEKEEETYYDNQDTSDNLKTGGERRVKKESNIPGSTKEKDTIQNNTKEYKIKGALKRHLILSRDFVFSLSSTKKYYKKLQSIFRDYIDVIMSEYYKKVSSLTSAVKEATKNFNKKIIDTLTNENEEKLSRGIKAASHFITLFSTIKNIVEHIKNIKERFEKTFSDDGISENPMGLVDLKNINNFEDLHNTIVGIIISLMQASSIVLNESFKFLWDQINILILNKIMPAIIKGIFSLVGSLIETFIKSKLKSVALNVVATAISGTGIGFAAMCLLTAIWEGAKLISRKYASWFAFTIF